MSYVEKKTFNYDSGKVICYAKTTSLGNTPINCEFVPNISTGSIAWYNDYENFVPKFERLFVDLLFIVLIIYLIYGMIRYVKKMFF